MGIAGLIDGILDVASSSREMEPDEISRAKTRNGAEPTEYRVALDALAIYVQAGNPIEVVSLEELAEIYGEGGKILKWSELGITNAACASGEIIRVSRQNNSGTYVYFREVVLGREREFRLGSIDQSGSKDVVTLVSRTPCAIGYSGMAYHHSRSEAAQGFEKEGRGRRCADTRDRRRRDLPDCTASLSLYPSGAGGRAQGVHRLGAFG